MKRAVRPTRQDTRDGRVAYEPKKAPPFTIDELMRMRTNCLNSIQVFCFLFINKQPLFTVKKHVSYWSQSISHMILFIYH